MKLTRSAYALVAPGTSTGASFTSLPYDLLEVDIVGVQINYTGTAVGAFALLGSVDGVNYVPIYAPLNGTAVNTAAVPATATPLIFELIERGFEYLKVQYTYTSGTAGTCSVYVCGKRIGD